MLPANPLLNATAPAGSHLPVALLRQYAAGALAPAAQHRVEAHTLNCPRCADILEGLLQTPPATTDQALAQLQQRLRKRVQQPAPAARPALGQRQQHRWLAPQLAAAATLLLGLVAGGWWTWQQRHSAATRQQVTTVATPRPDAPRPTTAAQPAAPASAVQQPLAAKPGTAAEPLAAVSRPVARALGRRAPHAAARHTVDTLVVAAAPVATEVPPRAAAPVAAAPDSASYDRTARQSTGIAAAKLVAAPAPARVRASAMPAAPPMAPAPVGGYAALREKLRREASEFVPEAPEQPLSGSVQLRITIGADGKIQQISTLRGLRSDYDEEAQRLVCEGPAWVPGISGGRRATLVVDVAVPF